MTDADDKTGATAQDDQLLSPSEPAVPHPGPGSGPTSVSAGYSVGPHITVKTKVNMRIREVGADGKVTTIDVDPKAAKRFMMLAVGVGVLLVLVVMLVIVRMIAG